MTAKKVAAKKLSDYSLRDRPKYRSIENNTFLLAAMLTRVGRLNEIFLSAVHADTFGSMKHGFGEAWVLGFLLHQGAPFRSSPTQLCRHSLQTSGGMTKTLRRLEDAELITRHYDPGDRRALLVELTPKGEEWARGISDNVATRYADIIGKDGDAIYAVLRTVLSRLEDVSGKTKTDDWL